MVEAKGQWPETVDVDGGESEPQCSERQIGREYVDLLQARLMRLDTAGEESSPSLICQ